VKYFYKQSLLFFFYFTLSFIIGYSSLNRYNYEKLLQKDGALSDIKIYQNTVEKGFSGLYTEKRVAPRILTPVLSSYVYKFFKNKIGSWNPVFFSLLVINSFFVSLTCLLMSKFYSSSEIILNRALLPPPGNTSQFLFLTSFCTANIYLSGLIDSSICYFIFLFIYSFLNQKYLLAFLSVVLLALSKETSFIDLFLFFFSYFFYEFFLRKKIIIKEFFYAIFFYIINLVIINFLIFYFLKMNLFQYIFHFLATSEDASHIYTFLDLFKFLIYLLPTIFFFFYGIKYFNKKFISTFIIMIFSFLFLFFFFIRMPGVATGRYFFNLLGPCFCLICGCGLNFYCDDYNNFIKKS
jgi:hypothetical protein